MRKRKPTGKPRGRPRKDIDPAAVESVIAAGYSVEGAAAELGIAQSTLRANFSEALQKGRDRRNCRLQVTQFNLAMDGNPTMLIWLGKQWLDQTDKREVKTEDTTPKEGEFRVAGKSREEILREIARRLGAKDEDLPPSPNGSNGSGHHANGNGKAPPAGAVQGVPQAPG